MFDPGTRGWFLRTLCPQNSTAEPGVGACTRFSPKIQPRNQGLVLAHNRGQPRTAETKLDYPRIYEQMIPSIVVEIQVGGRVVQGRDSYSTARRRNGEAFRMTHTTPQGLWHCWWVSLGCNTSASAKTEAYCKLSGISRGLPGWQNE